MKVSDRKMDMVQRLFEIEDEKVLDEVQAILDAAKDDSWYESLSEIEKSEVAEAESDIAEGRVRPHAMVMDRLREWKTNSLDRTGREKFRQDNSLSA